jgi:hypothetical protein
MRSEQHRRNVAELPCAECGLYGYSQAAHANSHVFGKGLGLKSSDLATFPLCASRPGEVGCHVRHDERIGMTREEADAREVGYILPTLMTLAAMGKLKAAK